MSGAPATYVCDQVDKIIRQRDQNRAAKNLLLWQLGGMERQKEEAIRRWQKAESKLERANNKQSKKMSAAEIGTNLFVGYGLAILAQIILYPMYGMECDLASNFELGAWFTAISFVRGFGFRRLFEAFR